VRDIHYFADGVFLSEDFSRTAFAQYHLAGIGKKVLPLTCNYFQAKNLEESRIGMNDMHLVVFFLKKNRVCACAHFGGSLHLGKFRKNFIPGLLRNGCRVVQSDDPVYPFQVGVVPVILVF